MRKFIYFVYLALFLSVTANAMDYQKETCTTCNGCGSVWSGYVDYFGRPIPRPCPKCGGYGYVLVPASYNPSFDGSGVAITVYNESGKRIGTGNYHSYDNTVSYNNVRWDICQSNLNSFEGQLCGSSGKHLYFVFPK